MTSCTLGASNPGCNSAPVVCCTQCGGHGPPRDSKEQCSAGCQSMVATDSHRCSKSRLITGTTSSPYGTARAPPGQKSFCTSTMINASVSGSTEIVLMASPPPLQAEGFYGC